VLTDGDFRQWSGDVGPAAGSNIDESSVHGGVALQIVRRSGGMRIGCGRV
jgi:hypothetical protein